MTKADFACCFQQQYKTMFGYAKAISSCVLDAEDYVQFGYIKMMAKADIIRNEDFLKYARTTIHRIWLDDMKKRSVRIKHAGALNYEYRINRNEIKLAEVLEGRSSLFTDFEMLTVLWAISGYGYEEMSLMTERSEESHRQDFCRAIKKMRDARLNNSYVKVDNLVVARIDGKETDK